MKKKKKRKIIIPINVVIGLLEKKKLEKGSVVSNKSPQKIKIQKNIQPQLGK